MISLHHVQYGRSFRVLWLIEEIGEDVVGPVEIIEHQIGTKEMAESDLRLISPAVRIPAIEIDGLAMSESGAIIQYLCETYAPDLDRPAGDPERTEFLQWIGYAETQASLIDNLNLQLVFLRPPAKPSPVVVKLTVARLKQTLRGLEAHLEGREWLLSSGFSGADIMMGFNLFAVPFYVEMEAFPNVMAYKARAEARPAYQRAVLREGPQRFYKQDFYPVPEV